MKLNKKMLTEDIKKVPGLIFAFLIIAYGMVQMKDIGIGMHSWATLNLGIIKVTHLPFGRISQLVGLTIILFSLFLKIYPGIGTVLNMIFIGFFIDLIDPFPITFTPNNYILKILAFYFGIVLFSYGIYLYLSYELGAGPRDGLMVGLVKITGLSVKYIKPAIELTVLVIGFLLGGTVGLGTVLVSLTSGYILDLILQWKDFNPKQTQQKKLTDYLLTK
jgi:uncharacterized membrane protein YczE